MKAGLVLLFFTIMPYFLKAQKFGYIESDKIVSKLPGYNNAQNEIDNLSQGWQQEIEQMELDIKKLYNALEVEQVLLTEEMKEERMDEIKKKEMNLKMYQRKIFGYEGLLFLKKQELIKPLQDKIFEAVRRVAKKNSLAIVFDRAGELIMVYTDPRHDYTDFVLEELGLGDSNDVIK